MRRHSVGIHPGRANKQPSRAHEISYHGSTLVDRPSVRPQLTSQRNLLSSHSVRPPAPSQHSFDCRSFPKPTAHTPCRSTVSVDFSFDPGIICQEVEGKKRLQKELPCPSQGMKEGSPKQGCMCGGFLSRSFDRGGGEAGENNQASLVSGLRCQYGCRRFQEELMGSWQAHVHSSAGRSPHIDPRAQMARQGQIKNMEVVEDFESRPHKLLTFLAESVKELQELSGLKMPGYNGGKLAGRSKTEGSKEGNGVPEERR